MDKIEAALFEKQQAAIKSIPESLLRYPITAMPLRAYNITGIDNVRRMLSDAGAISGKSAEGLPDFCKLEEPLLLA